MMSNASTSTATLAPPAKNRITRELSMLSTDPPPGISCYAPTDNLTYLHATIVGPPETPFDRSIYLLTIQIPSRYPFEPPRVRFVTPIHHPNIDSAGRICLDTLKNRPAGSWSPAVSLPSLLLSIRSLMADPNAEDGLVANVTKQFKENYESWRAQAAQLAQTEATDDKLVKSEEGLLRQQSQQLERQNSGGSENGNRQQQQGSAPRQRKMFVRRKEQVKSNGVTDVDENDICHDENRNGDLPQAIRKRKSEGDSNGKMNGDDHDGDLIRNTRAKH